MFSFKNKKKKALEINKEPIAHDKYLDLRKSVDNWRRLSSLLMIFALLLGFGLFKTSETNKIQTFILEKEGNTYSILGTVHDLAQTQNKASEEQIIYFLNNFVTKTKFLTPNLALYKKNYEEVLSFMSNSTQTKLARYLVEDNYKEKIQKQETVEIVFNTGIRLEGNSYQLRWTQNTFNKNGVLYLQENFMGVFNLEFVDIKDRTTLLHNPLGILINDFIQTKEKL